MICLDVTLHLWCNDNMQPGLFDESTDIAVWRKSHHKGEGSVKRRVTSAPKPHPYPAGTRFEKWCVGCGEKFSVIPNLRDQQKYCSARCRDYFSKGSTKESYVFEYLSKHPCVDCGEPDPVVLHFDHVRGVKMMTISAATQRGTLAALVQEIEKCDVRCVNCHLRRHSIEKKFYRTRMTG